MDNNWDELPEAVSEELEQSPASQLDIFYIRKTLSNHAKSFEEISNSMKKIETSLEDAAKSFKQSLFVEVVNGKTEERNIGELIKELWERDATKRDVKNLKDIIFRNKRKTIAALLTLLFFLIVFRDRVVVFIDWLANNFFDIIKWII